ncbi:hypothetical protein DLK06_15735 [Acinetobacter pittii]|nr:hypothetical protein DLK06_15735 [Acinetobacter pittii]
MVESLIMTLTLEERVRLFGSPIPEGFTVRVVESGTVINDEIVSDTKVVANGYDLYMTDKVFETMRDKCLSKTSKVWGEAKS